MQAVERHLDLLALAVAVVEHLQQPQARAATEASPEVAAAEVGHRLTQARPVQAEQEAVALSS